MSVRVIQRIIFLVLSLIAIIICSVVCNTPTTQSTAAEIVRGNPKIIIDAGHGGLTNTIN